jgi:hypothetical protein
MQDFWKEGFIVCMKQFLKHIGWAVAMVLLLLTACAKYDYAVDPQRGMYEKGSEEGQAIGTVRSQDGVRFIRLDGVSASMVVNPTEIKDIPDGTRVYLQFRYVVAETVADFCADAILVEWASPLEVGEIRYDMMAKACDPVHISSDWMTSLEDGFLTLHYTIQASGSVKHDFSLYPGVEPHTYRLVHDAHGDSKGDMTDGLVCFDVSGLLPETGEERVELSLEYIDLQNTNKRLTVEYQSPK